MKPGDDETSTSALVGRAVSWLIGCLLFVPLWAVLNFGFGTALDGSVGAFVMERPCQRLAGTTQPLERYALSGKGRWSSSVCHFARSSSFFATDSRIPSTSSRSANAS